MSSSITGRHDGSGSRPSSAQSLASPGVRQVAAGLCSNMRSPSVVNSAASMPSSDVPLIADREARSWSASARSLHRILAQAALLISRACVARRRLFLSHGQPK